MKIPHREMEKEIADSLNLMTAVEREQVRDYAAEYGITEESAVVYLTTRELSRNRMGETMNRSVINHPEHYQFPHVAREMADITIHLPHGLGSAMEYLWRAGKKPGAEAVEDLQKAIWWIYREIADIERKEPEEF